MPYTMISGGFIGIGRQWKNTQRSNVLATSAADLPRAQERSNRFPRTARTPLERPELSSPPDASCQPAHKRCIAQCRAIFPSGEKQNMSPSVQKSIQGHYLALSQALRRQDCRGRAIDGGTAKRKSGFPAEPNPGVSCPGTRRGQKLPGRSRLHIGPEQTRSHQLRANFRCLLVAKCRPTVAYSRSAKKFHLLDAEVPLRPEDRNRAGGGISITRSVRAPVAQVR